MILGAMQPSKKHHKQYILAAGLVVVIALAGYTIWALGRPLPAIRTSLVSARPATAATTAQLSWPSVGQAAVGLAPFGVLATHGVQTPAPTASVAKVLTALSVLKKYPLAQGESGPTITLTQRNVDIYNQYVAAGGSVAKVSLGDQLTEYQMLQAMMLPSANNIADSLSLWAFGTHAAYASYALDYAHQLGMKDTAIGADASGLDPGTTATASDLVLLGQAAMQNPVLAAIVNQQSAVIPDAGTVTNVNFLVGTHNIVGIKTGNSDQAGGVFLGATKTTVNGHPLTLITAIVGATDLYQALSLTPPLASSTAAEFGTFTALPAATAVGRYTTAWGETGSLITVKPLSAFGWKASQPAVTVSLDNPTQHNKPGDKLGTVSISKSPTSESASVNVTLQKEIKGPSPLWRLTHPR
ncbi:MAG: peptidase D-alanyl-D-alanine carboxypeptidase 1, D-alanyl-D-alanine carboxypeptidase [Candidatus Saccharibacteria bacterium]|nr:peptidase D-alanyl-D-alanine carboxypeptidase 1, D-alanyl-D-alanine carboxypeptidase [Candidatus Saccharibacteria bacterium]